MRLWHIDLLSYLPQQWLLGQHRECCALRGKGWGKQHSTINYVFNHDYFVLYQYHKKVMSLLNAKVEILWWRASYRGKIIGDTLLHNSPNYNMMEQRLEGKYPEHTDEYYIDCCSNLIEKFIVKQKQEQENISYYYWEHQIKLFTYLRDVKIKKFWCL